MKISLLLCVWPRFQIGRPSWAPCPGRARTSLPAGSFPTAHASVFCCCSSCCCCCGVFRC